MDACRSPVVLPSFVAQHSVILRHAALQDEDSLGREINLPPDLKGASFKRKVEFLAGRYCARRAIYRLAPCRRLPDIPRTSAGVPLWPNGMVGSITHTGGFVSAAVALCKDAAGIGIDSESLMATKVALEVARLVATKSELAATKAKTLLNESEALTLLFSAKESVFKCLYPLIEQVFDFLEIEIFIAETAPSRFTARLPVACLHNLPHEAELYGAFELDGSYCHTGIVLAVDSK
jgi:enterobactin synthetase component D